jgi:hypothetical protein
LYLLIGGNQDPGRLDRKKALFEKKVDNGGGVRDI